jgi:hypothetical protein
VLLLGDSLAFQLGPPLWRQAREVKQRVHVRAHGGSSARQWIQRRWVSRAASSVRAERVLVSLGVNCTRSERPRLAQDIATIVDIIADLGAPTLWLLPPPLRFSTEYLVQAVSEAGVPSFAPGPLPMESDGVHPTYRGQQRWAQLLVAHLWGRNEQ